MPTASKRYILTGGTGLLGRNLLFEILKQNIDNLENTTIFFLGRESEFFPLRQRVKEIIRNDGIYYLGVKPDNLQLFEKILNSIKPIGFDLTQNNLGLSKEGINQLKSAKNDFFFHVAALTNFMNTQSVKEKLEEINVVGTMRIVNLLDHISVDEAIFVSSAYVAGTTKGKVSPDHVDLKAKFRNPYEESKLKAEVLFRAFAESRGMKHRIFRPTTISGRLCEERIGSTPKFDVFYGWAAFFLRIKQKQLGTLENIYETPLKMPIRIQVNKNSGLNIIPVDYAAKIIYEATIFGHKDKNFHLAHPEDIPHEEYIKHIFESLNINGYEFVEDEPKDKNELEKFYYKTVGKIFTPYIVGDSLTFDVENLIDIHKKIKYHNLKIDRKKFLSLLDYAKKRHFHIDKKSV